MALEELFDDLGGFGRFQLLMITTMYPVKAVQAWSMMQMSYAGLVPDYNCVTDNDGSQSGNGTGQSSNWFNQSQYANDSLNTCSVDGKSCSAFAFHGEERTVINEWDLVCDLKWIKATMTSVQMGGVLVGAAVAGHCGDYFGRKKTLYLAHLLHGVFNLIAGFSVSWLMFAIMRFCIGLCIGAVIVILVPYCTEFLPLKWRALIPVIPFWPIGVSMFSGTAYLVKDWAHLHFACAAFAVPWLFSYIYLPDSVRWLTVQGRTKEAYAAIERIAKINGKPVPAYTAEALQNIAKEEEASHGDTHNYTYIDIFRGKVLARTTLIFAFHWMTFSTVFYGLGFAVSSLAGNVYLNIFIMNIMDLPLGPIYFGMANKLGRRGACALYLAIGSVSAFACLLVRMEAEGDYKGALVTVLSMISRVSAGAAWITSQIWVVEVYPTVIRSLGYGMANTAARVGGIIAPFAINLDDMVVFSYILMGSIYVISFFLTFLVHETKDQTLNESMKTMEVTIETKEDGDEKFQEKVEKQETNGTCPTGEMNIKTIYHSENGHCNAEKFEEIALDDVQSTGGPMVTRM